jgi:hypothetical protein
VRITTPNYKIKLNQSYHNLSKLILYAYTIKGVSVTNGIPDDTFFNIRIGDLNPTWVRSDQSNLVALAVTDQFTHEHLPRPIQFVTQPGKSLEGQNIIVTGPDGQPAVFTEMLMWFTMTAQSF